MASRAECVRAYSSPLFNQLTCSQGVSLRVNWDKSNGSWLWCVTEDGREGFVPTDHLRVVHDEEALARNVIVGECDDDDLLLKDNVLKPPLPEQDSASSFSFSFSLASMMNSDSGPSGSSITSSIVAAPVIAPGLRSLIWPLSVDSFMETYDEATGTPERLVKVREDFLNFDVEKLVAGASDCVAWLKTIDGQMQHFYTDNKTAYCCYLAGHSLYFNPPEDVQKAYIKELTEDLGINFGREKEGGFGGDIEVFACRGRHVTAWHFDGQENFTIQLRGTKRWSVIPSGLPCPLTNQTNPNSTAQDKYLAQRRCHASYSPTGPLQVPSDFTNAKTFVLRPGSVMYFPAGCWHHVTADSDEGSLSINLSLTTLTWLDVCINGLTQLMWKDPAWRQNVLVKDPSSARGHLRSLLQKLPEMVSDLKPKDLLPDGLFLENREKVVDVTTHDQGCHIDATKQSMFQRNPLAVLLSDTLDNRGEMSCGDDKGDAKETWTLDVAFGNKDFTSSLQVRLLVPQRLGCVIRWLEARQCDGAVRLGCDPRERWKPFSGGEVYEESGYRAFVRRWKERREEERKASEGHGAKEKRKKKQRVGGEDEGDMVCEEGGDEEGDELGFGEVEGLLSVLVFNGYLRALGDQEEDEQEEKDAAS